MKLDVRYSSIIKIAYPLVLGTLAHQMINVFDMIFMGAVGELEQAALGYAGLFYLILFMIGYSYTKGEQILIALKAGQGKPAAIGLIFDNTLLLLATLAASIFTLFYFFSEFCLPFFLKNKDVIMASVDYLKPRSVGIFFSLLGSAIIAFYSGIGRTKILIVGISLMAAINIVLNYLLIFGFYGFPKMGIAGAGLASSIAEAASATFLIIALYLGGHVRHFKMFKFKALKWRILGRISDLSLPLVAQSLIGLGAWLAFFSFIEKMGEDELAASNVIKTIYMMAGIPCFALGNTTNTVVSNMLGQKKLKEMFIGLKRIVLLSLGLTAILSGLLFLFDEQVLHIFNHNPDQIKLSLGPLYMIIGALFIYAISHIIFNAIVSMGKTRVSLLIEVVTVLVYLIYIYWLFNIYRSSLIFSWTSEWVYWLVIMILSMFYLRFGGWKNNMLSHGK